MAVAGIFGIVLAGGEGKRLLPLTLDRAKPAVPFGGNYRLVDFALSNLVNAGYLKIAVLTQYKSHSLDRHITTTWRLSPLLGNYVTPVPAQQRRGPHWFSGSADAIYQSLNLIYDERPEYVCVFGADHIYRMDPAQMVGQHIATGAGVTVAAIPVPLAEASRSGVIERAASGSASPRSARSRRTPKTIRRRPGRCSRRWATTSSRPTALIDAVTRDARNEDSPHDLGSDIIPMLVSAARPTCTTSRRTRCPATTSATAATGATSGRSTRTTTRTWT